MAGPSASPSSSSITTLPTTSSPSISTSVPSSSGHGGSPFSSNGTAALILAFLAIGLFVGGMVAMIGLRRRALERAQRWISSETPSPVWAQDYPEPESPSGRGRYRRRKKDVGTPPKLYDVYAPAKGVASVSWRTILPLSTRAVPQSVPSAPSPEVEDVSQDAHNRWHFDALGFFHWAPSPRTPSPIITPPLVDLPVQVAVIIAMPSPADEISSSLGFDYSLGLTQITCHDIEDLYDLNTGALAERRVDAAT